MITRVTPDGPRFFWAPAYTTPKFAMSIGRLKMSDDASLTSGASPAAGRRCHWVPSIVLFEVMWT